MKIMTSWMALEEIPDHKIRRYYKDADGRTTSKKFEYRWSFGLHFKFRQQADDHNNRRHLPISVERSMATKFWPDRNFTHCLVVSEWNTNLAKRH